jgi:hypothetical protein
MCVADVDGDGRPDLLYAAGKGQLYLNKPERFVEADSGIAFQAGRVGPTFADVDGDGKPDLFVPQPEGGKLFRNLGGGKFEDVSAASGDLAQPLGEVAGAHFDDFFNDGRMHLVLACLRGPNRFFRNQGQGKFVEETDKLGLHKRILYSQAVQFVDLNGDGMLDLVCLNEASDSLAFLGNKEIAGTLTPVVVQLRGKHGLTGATVRVLDKAGQAIATRTVGQADGRGGQSAYPFARFTLPTDADLTVEVRFALGAKATAKLAAPRRPSGPIVVDAETKNEGK